MINPILSALKASSLKLNNTYVNMMPVRGPKSHGLNLRKSAAGLVAVITLALLGACSGDARPLEEAVETSELGLRAISIRQPTSFLPDLVVNTGERIKFVVEGINESSEVVELPSEGRRWRVVTDASAVDGTYVSSSLASIDENGGFVATNQGNVVVRIQIGGLAANFPVTISNETLSSITSIVGPTSVERCLGADYYAVGTFSAGSKRALPNATWGVDNSNLGFVTDAIEDGDIALIGRNPGAITLVASVGTVNAQTLVTVQDTLTLIEITPETLAMDTDSTESVTARGHYTRGNTFAEISITEHVVWSVPSGNGIASISNTAPTIGQITSGDDAGSTIVTATCGSVRQDRELVVVDSD